MDIDKHLRTAWLVLKNEPLFSILGGIIVLLMNLLSIGLLVGPIFGGYVLAMILLVRDNKRPMLSDLFEGFQRIGELWVFLFVILLVLIGFVCLVIPGLVMLTWWIYTLPLMVDKKLPLAKAMATSRRVVQEKGFLMHLVFIFMITMVISVIINIISAFIPFMSLLHLLVTPFQCACLVSLYLEQFPTAQFSPSKQSGHNGSTDIGNYIE